MKVVKDWNDFSILSKHIDLMLFGEKEIPQMVFRTAPQNIAIIPHTDIRDMDFIDKMIPFLKDIHEKRFWICSVNPDPVNYYYKHFEFYGAFDVSVDTSRDEYYRYFSNFPEGYSADSLCFRPETLFLSSESYNWGIYTDRDWDVAVAWFSEDVVKTRFLSAFGYSDESKLVTDMYVHLCAWVGNEKIVAELYENYGVNKPGPSN